MSRKPLFTDDQIAEALISTSGIRTDAAVLLKCSRSTIKRYIDRSEVLARIEREAVEQLLDLAESKLADAINAGNLTAIMFYLKTKGKHRGYTERHQVEGKDGGPVEVKARLDLSGLSAAGIRFLQDVVQGLSRPDNGAGVKESGGAPVGQTEADGEATSDPTKPEAESHRI